MRDKEDAEKNQSDKGKKKAAVFVEGIRDAEKEEKIKEKDGGDGDGGEERTRKIVDFGDDGDNEDNDRDKYTGGNGIMFDIGDEFVFDARSVFLESKGKAR